MRSFDLVLSNSLLKEMQTALEKDFFVERFPTGFESDVSHALRRAETTPLSTLVNGIASHPEDDLVLAVAIFREGRLPGDRRQAIAQAWAR